MVAAARPTQSSDLQDLVTDESGSSRARNRVTALVDARSRWEIRQNWLAVRQAFADDPASVKEMRRCRRRLEGENAERGLSEVASNLVVLRSDVPGPRTTGCSLRSRWPSHPPWFDRCPELGYNIDAWAHSVRALAAKVAPCPSARLTEQCKRDVIAGRRVADILSDRPRKVGTRGSTMTTGPLVSELGGNGDLIGARGHAADASRSPRRIPRSIRDHRSRRRHRRPASPLSTIAPGCGAELGESLAILGDAGLVCRCRR